MAAFGTDVSSNQILSAGRRQNWARRAGRERGHVNDLAKVHSGSFRSVSTPAQDGAAWRKGGARRAALGPRVQPAPPCPPQSSQLLTSLCHNSVSVRTRRGSSVVERRTPDPNVSDSKPGRSGGRISFSGGNFLC